MSEYVLDKITDYKENLRLFLTQYQDSVKLTSIMSSAYDQANDIETALFEIRDEMDIETAVGTQLDILGRVFNEERLGRNDDDYRVAIKLKASTIYSGEPEAIIAILKSFFGATSVKYFPNYPGKYYVYTDTELTFEVLKPFSPAGVEGAFGYALVTEDGKFIVTEDGKKLLALL